MKNQIKHFFAPTSASIGPQVMLQRIQARCSMTRDEWRRTQVLAMNAPSPIMDAADRIKDLEVLRFLLQLPNERLIPEDLVNVFPGVTREVGRLLLPRSDLRTLTRISTNGCVLVEATRSQVAFSMPEQVLGGIFFKLVEPASRLVRVNFLVSAFCRGGFTSTSKEMLCN